MQKAEEYLEDSSKSKNDKSPGNRLSVLFLHNTRALIEAKQKNYTAARKESLEAAELMNDFIKESFNDLSFAQKCSFVQLADKQICELLTYCHESENLSQAYTYLMRWKGLLVDSLRAESQLLSSAESNELRLELLKARIALSAGLNADGDYTANSKRKEVLERKIGRLLKASKVEDPMIAWDSRNFHRVLKDGEAFVDFSSYRPSLDQPLHYAAILVSGRDDYKFIDLGAEAQIDSQVREWVDSITNTNGNIKVSNLIAHKRKLRDAIPEDSEPEADNQGAESTMKKQVLNAVWNPIKRQLPNKVTHLWLCPDRELARIPWNYLTTSTKNDTIFISTVNSARELVSLRQRATAPISHNNMLLVGPVTFTNAPDLPGTRVEVAKVKDLATAKGIQTSVLLNAEATKSKIQQAAESASYIHFATHGFFNAEQENVDQLTERTLRLSTLSKLRSCSTKPLSAGRDPLLQSGLLTAPSSDGKLGSDRLTAEELASLDLKHCELVSLSACDTGRGKEFSGQGVLGLRSALISAGANSLLISLWKVDDEATCKLMEEFYKNLWKKKLPKAQALLQAQQTIKNTKGWSSPKYWAGWQIAGKAW